MLQIALALDNGACALLADGGVSLLSRPLAAPASRARAKLL